MLLWGLATAAPAAAQDEGWDAPPAHLSAVDGTALLERDGRAETAQANTPLLAGDRLRTEAGRLEVLFADHSTLHLDQHTTVDLLSDDLIRLLAGRVRVTVAGDEQALAYRIDAPAGSVEIDRAGDYRVSMFGTRGALETELAVLRGEAQLVNEHGATLVRAGERARVAEGHAPSYPYVFNSAAWDAFDRWSEDRRAARLGVRSAQYLPRELHAYGGAFDRHGRWSHHPTYGPVWYPVAPVGWRPYYHGHWSYVGPFGWTWVGLDPWAWPTHHFGRWGLSAGVWFWIPGRVWAPHWVAWAHAPGYVAWAPLGFHGRPVIGFTSVVVRRGYDPWRAWTVLPVRHFRAKAPVFRHHVRGAALAPDLRSRFVVHRTVPVTATTAVRRDGRPLRAPGRAVVGRAVPRGGHVATGDTRSRAAAAAETLRRSVPPAQVNRPAESGRADLQAPRASSGRGPTATRQAETTRDRVIRRPGADGAPSAAPAPRTSTPQGMAPRARRPAAVPSDPAAVSSDPTVGAPSGSSRRAAPRSAPAARPPAEAGRSETIRMPAQPRRAPAPAAVEPGGSQERQSAAPAVRSGPVRRAPGAASQPADGGRSAVPAQPSGFGGRSAAPARPSGSGGRSAAPAPRSGEGGRSVAPAPRSGEGGRSAVPARPSGSGGRSVAPAPRPGAAGARGPAPASRSGAAGGRSVAPASRPNAPSGASRAQPRGSQRPAAAPAPSGSGGSRAARRPPSQQQ